MSKSHATNHRVNDPFALARSFFGFEPFIRVQARPAAPRFSPRFEVRETEQGYVLTADIPGVKEEELDISFHRKVLTVRGQRTEAERAEGETYHLYERHYGEFSRSFTLPEEADEESIHASLEAGVLTVTIGKKARAKPRKIALT